MRIHPAGAGALLLDAAGASFDAAIQRRIWSTARALEAVAEIAQIVPGVNNLLVTFDPLSVDPEIAETQLTRSWMRSTNLDLAGREFVIAVDYSLEFGLDLDFVASHAGLARDEVIALHVAGHYRVAAIGSTPGFAYLTGLDPSLCTPRRPSPRMSVPKGAVTIGGSHTSINPSTAPSGWHILGRAEIELFDPEREAPCLLQPGDTIRFERLR